MQGRLIAISEIGRRIGQGHHNAKLQDSDIDLVFRLREAGLSLSVIGKKFGVQRACIWKILHGYTRAETPAEWRPAGTRRTSPPRSKPAPVAQPGEDGPGAMLQRHLNDAWR